MIVQPYYLACLSHASYLIADEETGEAAVIDPQRDIDQYLADAESNGWRITTVFLTHFHADFISGHLDLRDRVGAEIVMGAAAEAEFDFHAVREGDVVTLGESPVRVLETPGHTPEGICLVIEESGPDEPAAVFTGDTLFIGDVGRPDLMASVGLTAEELAERLYDSLHDKLLQLSDDTMVYPAHGAGSMCGRQLSVERESTIGEQRRTNYALRPMSKEAFVRLVTADQPEAPAYFARDAALNKMERHELDDVIESSLRPLSLDEALDAARRGATLLDVRDPVDFAGGHIEGSLNIGLSGKFATWAGTLLDHKRPVVVIAEPGDEREAVTRLGRVGQENVAGYLNGGMAALSDREDLVRTTERITVSDAKTLLAGHPSTTVLDVRTAAESESAGSIRRSENIPLADLPGRIGELTASHRIIVHCAGGYRSSIACSILKQHGRRAVDLIGGFAAWQAADSTENTGVQS